MSKILIAIDGTGPGNPEDYDSEMSQSFVHQIYLKSGIPQDRKIYRRGPSTPGLEDPDIEADVLNTFLAMLKNVPPNETVDVYITGYSRGAMLCVVVANSIAAVQRRYPRPMRICKMLLFDPVCMDVTFKDDQQFQWYLATNAVYDLWYLAHMRPTDTNMLNTASVSIVPAMAESVIDLATQPSRTRWYFKRLHLQPESARTAMDLQTYDCTHAGIGGLPGTGDNAHELKVPVPSVSISVSTQVDPVFRTVTSTVTPYMTTTTVSSPGVTVGEDFKEYEKVYNKVNDSLGGFDISGKLDKFNPRLYGWKHGASGGW